MRFGREQRRQVDRFDQHALDATQVVERQIEAPQGRCRVVTKGVGEPRLVGETGEDEVECGHVTIRPRSQPVRRQ